MLCCIPLGIIHGGWWFDTYPGLCTVLGTVAFMACYASVLSLAAISVNRYIQICHPDKYYMYFTTCRSFILCLAIWIISFFFAISPHVFGWSKIIFDWQYSSCLYDRVEDYSYTLIMIAGENIFANIVIAFSSSKIYIYVKASKSRIATNNDTCNRKSTWDLAKTLFMVYVTFVICWLPYTATVSIDYKNRAPEWWHIVCACLAYSNSCFNSIIYGFTNNNFREGYIKMLFIFLPTRCHHG